MLKIFDSASVFFFILIFAFFIKIIKINEVIAQDNSTFRIKSHLIFNKKFSGKAKVIDGDSLKVGNKEIRLYGIDAPEYKQKCLNKINQEYSCGIDSLNFLAKLVDGKKIICYYANKDKYNRYLSNCYYENIFINEEIIKNGMAVIYNFSENNINIENLEKLAKSNKIGIWQGS